MSTAELFTCIRKNQTERVCELLDQQPQWVGAVDDERWSALQVAVMYGCNRRSQHTRPTVEAIIRRLPRMTVGDAAMMNDEARLRRLIDQGADLSATDARGWTPLHWAAEMGNAETARILLEAGADPNASSPDGPPLERASHPGPNKPSASQPVIDLLIEHGAAVDVHCAALIGDVDRLARLIEDDAARLNARDKRGATPLFHAAHNLHLDCVNLLLDRGADVNIPCEDGQTAISTAVGHMWDTNGPEVVQRILAEQPELDFFTAAQVNDAEKVRAALADDPSLANAESWEHRVLYLAAGTDASEVVTLLAQAGAELDWRRHHDGMNALLNAIWHHKKAATRALLDAGADPDVADFYGNTALHAAVLCGQSDVVEWILQRDPDQALGNKRGHTAADIARLEGKDDILAKLTG